MSIIKQIEDRIKSFGKGSIFYPDDFIDLGTSDAIRQSLIRLCKDEKIVRVAQGIYCYPHIDEELGLGIIMPTSDEIARSLAKRDHSQYLLLLIVIVQHLLYQTGQIKNQVLMSVSLLGYQKDIISKRTDRRKSSKAY